MLEKKLMRLLTRLEGEDICRWFSTPRRLLTNWNALVYPSPDYFTRFSCWWRLTWQKGWVIFKPRFFHSTLDVSCQKLHSCLGSGFFWESDTSKLRMWYCSCDRHENFENRYTDIATNEVTQGKLEFFSVPKQICPFFNSFPKWMQKVDGEQEVPKISLKCDAFRAPSSLEWISFLQLHRCG